MQTLFIHGTISEHDQMKRTFNEAFTLFLSHQERYKLKNGAINATAVARDLEVTPRTASNMLSNKDYGPREPMLKKMCAVFGVSGDQIMGNVPFDWEEGAERYKNPSLTNLSNDHISIFTLARLREDYDSVHQAVNDKAYSERFALPSRIADSEHMITIKIEDESNTPVIKTGDIVLIDIRKPAKVGDRVLALADGEYVIRTLGEGNELFAENRLYKSKVAEKVCGTCINKVTIEKL